MPAGLQLLLGSHVVVGDCQVPEPPVPTSVIILRDCPRNTGQAKQTMLIPCRPVIIKPILSWLWEKKFLQCNRLFQVSFWTVIAIEMKFHSTTSTPTSFIATHAHLLVCRALTSTAALPHRLAGAQTCLGQALLKPRGCPGDLMPASFHFQSVTSERSEEHSPNWGKALHTQPCQAQSQLANQVPLSHNGHRAGTAGSHWAPCTQRLLEDIPLTHQLHSGCLTHCNQASGVRPPIHLGFTTRDRLRGAQAHTQLKSYMLNPVS